MFDFTVRPDSGEPYTAVASSRDIVQWEKRGKGRSLSKVAEAATMTDLYELAFLASRRLGHFGGTLPEFEQTVDLQFEESPGDSDGDPTQPAP